MKDDLLLPPNPSRVAIGLRDTGYTFNTAVADIIDNSVAAGANNIDVKIERNPIANTVVVYIADDGCGMNEEDLKNAMIYGSSERHEKNSLGKFGLGLKTASTAFCRSLSVISKGDDLIMRKVQWDLDYIQERGDWYLRFPEISDDERDCLNKTSENTGTLVVWEKVDRLLNLNKISSTKRKTSEQTDINKKIKQLMFHLSMTYQRFLDENFSDANNIRISVNNINLKPWDPFCLYDPTTKVTYNHDVVIEKPDGSTSSMHIKACVIPNQDEFLAPEGAALAHISNDLQGIYVYRSNRLISKGDWLGIYVPEQHLKLLRVELSFWEDLDDVFSIDIKKSRILLDEDLAVQIKEEILTPSRREAEHRYRQGNTRKINKAPSDAHSPANKIIKSKSGELESSKVLAINKGTEEIDLKNKYGESKPKGIYKIHAPQSYGVNVIPVDEIEYKLLWNPSICEDCSHGVLLNKSHLFYQRVYYPNLDKNPRIVSALDYIFWALAEAELSTFTENISRQYEDMRGIVSKILERLAEEIPEPKLSDQNDEE